VLNQKKLFFSEEKKQRLLFVRRSHDPGATAEGLGRDRSTDARAKVFCFFSSEKKIFLPSLMRVSKRFRHGNTLSCHFSYASYLPRHG
jgi:hypothetical protein